MNTADGKGWENMGGNVVPERIFVFEQTSPGTIEYEFNTSAYDHASPEQLHAELDALYDNDPTAAQRIWPGYELVQRAY